MRSVSRWLRSRAYRYDVTQYRSRAVESVPGISGSHRKHPLSMTVRPVPIADALIIHPQVHADSRGLFKESFSVSRYREIGIDAAFVQDNVSLSNHLVLRGLHGDPRMVKLVQVLEGTAYDVIADVRPNSPSFLKWYGVWLRASEHTQLYIPAGCLHGFLALEDGTLLSYKQSAEYDPTTEFGVAWNDPDLAIAWPLDGRLPILSPKDAANPTIRDRGIL
jgi:dTDP-4-dehydrorhamnose 3,5-epimerase